MGNFLAESILIRLEVLNGFSGEGRSCLRSALRDRKYHINGPQMQI